MNIVYDNEQPMQCRVQFISNDGTIVPIASYQIQVEIDGLIATYSRWGNAKVRKANAEAVAKALAKEPKP